MAGKVLAFVEIPKFEETENYRSFKITPRWQVHIIEGLPSFSVICVSM